MKGTGYLHTLKYSIAFIYLVLCFSLLAQGDIDMANRYQINKDGSYISFQTTMAGFPVIKGSISSYQATMIYNPENILNSSATIRIGTEDIMTAHEKRDSELRGEHFLDVSNFPSIWFQGSEVVPNDKGFELKGHLYIKEVVKPASVHITTPTLMPKAMNNLDLMIAKGSLAINRKDFGLGNSGAWASNPMLGEEINIEFHFMGFSYTIDYLKANFVKEEGGIQHPVGLVYNEVISKGPDAGMALIEMLSKKEAYKKDNWLKHLADIGWILMVDGHGKASLPFFEKALSYNSDHLTSLLRLGDAYVIANKKDMALQHFRKERSLEARARFTHIPHMIKLLSGSFELKNMK